MGFSPHRLFCSEHWRPSEIHSCQCIGWTPQYSYIYSLAGRCHRVWRQIEKCCLDPVTNWAHSLPVNWVTGATCYNSAFQLLWARLSLYNRKQHQQQRHQQQNICIDPELPCTLKIKVQESSGFYGTRGTSGHSREITCFVSPHMWVSSPHLAWACILSLTH